MCRGLSLLLGHAMPAAQTARGFLASFDEPELPLLGHGRSVVRAVSRGLRGLAQASAAVIADLRRRRPVRIATIDLGATVLASAKRAAKWAYDGQRGYLPVVALWAEQEVILADEFRDGNVSAANGVNADLIFRRSAEVKFPSWSGSRRFGVWRFWRPAASSCRRRPEPAGTAASQPSPQRPSRPACLACANSGAIRRPAPARAPETEANLRPRLHHAFKSLPCLTWLRMLLRLILLSIAIACAPIARLNPAF